MFDFFTASSPVSNVIHCISKMNFPSPHSFIYILCREEFDEEKEPEGMVLIGWLQAPTDTENKASVQNGESTSGAGTDQVMPLEIAEDEEAEVNAVSKKRNFSEISNSSVSHPLTGNDKTSKNKEVILEDEGDDLIVLDHLNSEMAKKKRLV